MIYGSVCSGIEAASVAWAPLGWRCAFVSEIEPFPCAVLAHHYPTVPNLGDMTKHAEWNHEPIDVLVGGTPCQSFSVAGLRAGMADPRGGLALVFLELARRARPLWVVWENVPGVLSADGGRAFGSFLGGLAELGYGFAYRVLDAQYFGMAQRRRRVFVVGHLGDWRRAATVLFERACLRGDPAPSREAGQSVAGALDGGAHGGGFDNNDARAGKCVARSLCANGKAAGSATQQDAENGMLVARSLNAHASRSDGESETIDSPCVSLPLEGGGGQAVAFDPYNLSEHAHQPTLGVNCGTTTGRNGVRDSMHVRRLTPRECERLQGFPTRIDRVIMEPCYDRDGTRLVRVALRCLSVQSDALPADESESGAAAWCADATFWNDRVSLDAAAALHVRVSHAPKVLRVLSRGRWLWSAGGAGADATFPLFTRPDSTARAVAALLPVLVAATRAGRAESRPSSSDSTHPENGNSLVVTFGPESEVAASDVPARLDAATKSTMSESGRDSQPCGLSVQTLLSCVCLATSGFTARPTSTAPSSAVVLDIESDYTLIPYRGKPAKDAPRYRALGNSMAVPVMRWIGQRLDDVARALGLG